MNVKKMTPWAGAAVLALFIALGAALPAAAEDGGATGTLAFGGFNRYIFRGYRLGGAGLVLQPSLSAAYKGFSLTFWGNIDTNEQSTPNFVPDRPGKKSFNETDITLSYVRAVGKFNLTAGLIYYGTKYTAETEELFVGAGLSVPGNPTLTVYQDIDAYPGTYFLFTAAQSFPLAGKLSLDLGGSAACMLGEGGYWKTYDPTTEAYVGEKYRALHDGMVKAGLSYPLGGGAGLQVLAQYWFPLSKDSSRAYGDYSYNINGRLKSVLVFGVNLTYAF